MALNTNIRNLRGIDKKPRSMFISRVHQQRGAAPKETRGANGFLHDTRVRAEQVALEVQQVNNRFKQNGEQPRYLDGVS